MAHGAILRKIQTHVVWNAGDRRGLVVVRLVAAVAGGRGTRVTTSRVALRALQIGMPVGEREELVVVEIRRIPAGRGVTSSAG